MAAAAASISALPEPISSSSTPVPRDGAPPRESKTSNRSVGFLKKEAGPKAPASVVIAFSESLERAHAVRGSPACRTRVGAELVGPGGAEIAAGDARRAAIRAVADVVEFLLELLFLQRPEGFAALVVLSVSGQAEHAAQHRRGDAGAALLDPAARAVRIVLGDAERDGGDVVTGALGATRILLPAGLAHDGAAAAGVAPDLLGVGRAALLHGGSTH